MRPIAQMRVKDCARARAFYRGLLGREDLDLDFAAETQASTANLTLEVSRELDEVLEFVWANGGRIVEPEPVIDGERFLVPIIDTEGNQVVVSALSPPAQKISLTPIEGSSGSASSSSSS